MLLLPIILIIRVVAFPDLPPILVGAYETEKACKLAFAEIDASVPTILLTHICLVDT